MGILLIFRSIKQSSTGWLTNCRISLSLPVFLQSNRTKPVRPATDMMTVMINQWYGKGCITYNFTL